MVEGRPISGASKGEPAASAASRWWPSSSSTSRDRGTHWPQLRPWEPGHHVRTAVLAPVPWGPYSQCSRREVPFLAPRDPAVFTSLLHAWKFGNLLNCILSQGPSSPKMHTVAAPLTRAKAEGLDICETLRTAPVLPRLPLPLQPPRITSPSRSTT